jgi:hypothetical protein
MLVTLAWNPSYLGGRAQENHSSKPTQANSLWDPTSKVPTTKRAAWVVQGLECLPNKSEAEFKPQYHQKKEI